MKGRWLVVLMFVVVVGVGVLVAVGPAPTNDTTALPADQQYPPGAGPNVINFTALDAAETNLTHTPRRHWESYLRQRESPGLSVRRERSDHSRNRTPNRPGVNRVRFVLQSTV